MHGVEVVVQVEVFDIDIDVSMNDHYDYFVHHFFHFFLHDDQ